MRSRLSGPNVRREKRKPKVFGTRKARLISTDIALTGEGGGDHKGMLSNQVGFDFSKKQQITNSL